MIYGIDAQVTETALSTPNAARFDNSSVACGLEIASQTAADSPLITVSMWVRANDVTLFPKLVSFGKYDAGESFLELGFMDQGQIWVELNPSAFAYALEFASPTFGISSNQIFHLFMSADTNHAAGAKLKNLYIDGTSSIDGAFTSDTSPAFNIGVNLKPFGFPDQSVGLATGAILDFAEVWIAYGQYVTDVTKFRTVGGAMVDLGADGSAPTGTPPTYYFKGASTTFATNLGTGDSPSVTGVIGDAFF